MKMLTEERKDFDIFVGSKIGSFKHIKFHSETTKNSKKCVENLVNIKALQKNEDITCMEWGNTEQTEILLGKRNQQIQTYDTLQGFTNSYTADFGTGHVIGLGRCKRNLIAGLSGGVVKVWSKKSESTIQAGDKLDVLKVCSEDPELFATGGEENDLKLWRINQTTPEFSAKNLSHDWLQLRRPVWVTSLCFLPGSGGKLVAACSRYGYVRLYDIRAQRRPVKNVEFEKMAATCIAPMDSDRQVVVGFGRGQLHQVDLISSKASKGYKDACGAVSSVAQGGGLLVSVSLDRHLRVHDVASKQLLGKFYLTSKLTQVLLQTQSSTPLLKPVEELKEEEAVEIKDDDDMDQLFDDMETIGEKSRKHKLEESVVEKSEPTEDDEDAIKKLLKSTEKQKKKIEKRKKEKKAKSVFHNA